MHALLVFLGGGTGALARWGLALLLQRPWGTLAANVAGSFLLALFVASPLGTDSRLKLLFGVGAMGGFTTYSTFNLELLEYLREGDWRMAALQGGLTLVGCLAGGGAGLWLASALPRS